MAVAPLQIPQLGAVSGGMDFSPLANLGNVYRQAQQEQQKREALSALASGDPSKLDIRPLLASGDMSLAQLGINLRNRDQDLQRQTERDRVGDQHWAASYDLQKRSADRADEGPVEKAQQRARQAASQRQTSTTSLHRMPCNNSRRSLAEIRLRANELFCWISRDPQTSRMQFARKSMIARWRRLISACNSSSSVRTSFVGGNSTSRAVARPAVLPLHRLRQEPATSLPQGSSGASNKWRRSTLRAALFRSTTAF
jgi:hypothetical protein